MVALAILLNQRGFTANRFCPVASKTRTGEDHVITTVDCRPVAVPMGGEHHIEPSPENDG